MPEKIYFRKVTIIGVGLMGGSLGLAIKNHRLAGEVAGVSQRQTTLVSALKVKAIDHAYHDLRKALFNSDLVILATPVNAIVNLLNQIGPMLKRGCIVTDVGSTKTTIVDTAEKVLPPHVFFVGSHPMAGSEKQGPDFASARLYENSLCWMTPTEKSNRGAVERVKQFWTHIGAQVKSLSPSEHDKILANISHLPHVMAYALMDAIPQQHLEFAAQGLKDTTRIAGSSPQMWNDICMANSKNLIEVLDQAVKILSGYRKMIVSRDESNLLEGFKRAKVKRDGLERTE